MIFIPLAAGAFFPQLHTLQWLIRWSLVFMLFFSYLRIDFSKLRPKPIHWYLLGINILMGVIPFLLIKLMGNYYNQIALAAFFVGITPSATTVAVVVGLLNGKVDFALTGFIILNICVSALLMGLIPVVTGQTSWDLVGNVGKTLATVVVLPMVLAQTVRRIHPASLEWSKRYRWMVMVMWSGTLFILSCVASDYVRNNPTSSGVLIFQVVGISLLICVLNFIIGRKMAPTGYSLECGQLLGQKNTTFTMYLALTFVNPLVAMGPISYILWHNLWNAWIIYEHDKDAQKAACHT